MIDVVLQSSGKDGSPYRIVFITLNGRTRGPVVQVQAGRDAMDVIRWRDLGGLENPKFFAPILAIIEQRVEKAVPRVVAQAHSQRNLFLPLRLVWNGNTFIAERALITAKNETPFWQPAGAFETSEVFDEAFEKALREIGRDSIRAVAEEICSAAAEEAEPSCRAVVAEFGQVTVMVQSSAGCDDLGQMQSLTTVTTGNIGQSSYGLDLNR
jgi:hypothetical protein